MICDPDKTTWTIAEDGKSITFQPCGFTSHNPNDVREEYCARCHRFMSVIEIARKLKKEMFPDG